MTARNENAIRKKIVVSCNILDYFEYSNTEKVRDE